MNPEELEAIRAEEARLGRPLRESEIHAVQAQVREGALARTRASGRLGLETTGGADDRSRPGTPRAPEAPADRAARLARESAADRDRAMLERRGSEGGIGDWLSRLPETVEEAIGPGYIADWLGSGTSGASGAVEGATMGFSDELTGAIADPRGAAMAFGRLTGTPMDTSSAENREALARYEAARDAARARMASEERSSPTAFLGGALAGGAATAPLLPTFAAAPGVTGGVTRAASAAVPRAARAVGGAMSRLGSAARAGAVYGALGGAGGSEEETAGGVARDAALGAGAGTVAGSVLGGAGEALGSAARAAPAWLRSAMIRRLSVPAGPGARTTAFARDLVGGRHPDMTEAAARLAASGTSGPMSSAAEVLTNAEALIRQLDVTREEREMIERGVRVAPGRLASAIRSVINEYPNASERALMGRLAGLADDLEARGAMPRFRVTGDRPVPAPSELASREPPPPAPTRDTLVVGEGPTSPERGAARRARRPTRSPGAVTSPRDDRTLRGTFDEIPVGEAGTLPPRMEAEGTLPPIEADFSPEEIAEARGRIADHRARRAAAAAAPPEEVTAARRPDARARAEAPPPARPSAAPTRPGLAGDTTLTSIGPPSRYHTTRGYALGPDVSVPEGPRVPGVMPEVPEPAAPRVRPRGERPIGARPMTGSWDAPPPRAERTIPYSGPMMAGGRRPPDSAMHALGVLDDLATYRAAEPEEPAHAAREARRRVRALLDRSMSDALGPEATARHTSARDRVRTAIAIRNAAIPAEVGDATRGARLAELGLAMSGAGGGFAVGGVPGALGGLAAATAPIAASRLIAPRAPAIAATATEAVGRLLGSRPVTGAARVAERYAPSASGFVSREVARRLATPDFRPSPERRRAFEALPPIVREPEAPIEAPPEEATPSASTASPSATGGAPTTRRARRGGGGRVTARGRAMFEELRSRRSR